MITIIKKILLKDIQEKIDKYDSLEWQIQDAQRKIDEEQLFINDEIIPIILMSKPSLMKENESLTFRLFHRSEYIKVKEENLKRLKEYDQTKKEYNRMYEEKNAKIKQLEELKKELEEQRDSLLETSKLLHKIKRAVTIKDLGLSFKEAKSLIEQNHEELVLGFDDKIIIENESTFDKKEDFVLVRKTNHPIIGDRECSSRKKGLEIEKTLYFGEQSVSYKYKNGRDTIHFAINGEVSSHEYGNFNDRKYAIIIPFSNVNTQNLASFNSSDTFFTSSVSTNGGYLLCPKEEVRKLQETNPNTTVVGYEGDDVDGFADAFLTMLGYKHEQVEKHSWGEKDKDKHTKFALKNNLPIIMHAGSSYFKNDSLHEDYYNILGFVKAIDEFLKNNYFADINDFIFELFNKRNSVVTKYGSKVVKDTKFVPSFVRLINEKEEIYQDQINIENFNIYTRIKNDFGNADEDSDFFLRKKIKEDFKIEIPRIDIKNEIKLTKKEEELLLRLEENGNTFPYYAKVDFHWIYNIVIRLYEKYYGKNDNLEEMFENVAEDISNDSNNTFTNQ